MPELSFASYYNLMLKQAQVEAVESVWEAAVFFAVFAVVAGIAVWILRQVKDDLEACVFTLIVAVVIGVLVLLGGFSECFEVIRCNQHPELWALRKALAAFSLAI